MEVRIFPDASKFVSETQMAECRSSKPDVAGSIPVAHSNIFGCRFGICKFHAFKQSKIRNHKSKQWARSFNRQNAGLQNRSFQFKSERACQTNFPKERKKNVISSPASHSPHFLDFNHPLPQTVLTKQGRQAKSVWQQS